MNISAFVPRLVATRIGEAMADTPVVLLAGPRQAGKTTLVRQIAQSGMRYLTLDDEISRPCKTLISAGGWPEMNFAGTTH